VVEDHDLIVPYKPITLYIPAHDEKNFPKFMLLLAVLVIGLITTAVYLMVKNRKL